MEQNPNSSILALDIGAVRVGVATASTEARLARPVVTLDHDEHIFERITSLCSELKIGVVVCGLPRGLDGQETSQTAYARDFAAKLPSLLGLPVYLIDEALTSVKAKEELENRARNKHRPYKKSDIDALAATYILEDYLADSTNAERVQD
jgi:putative Holliday junction resolvase